MSGLSGIGGLVKRCALGVVLVGLLVGLVGVAPAFAGSAWWGLTSGSWPSNLPPGGTGKVIVTAQNRGYTDAEGSAGNPIVVHDVLPEGLKAKSVEGLSGETGSKGRGALKCSVLSSGSEVQCVFEKGALPGEAALVPPFEQIEVRITVEVSETASGSEENTVSVSGGNLPGKTLARHITVGEESTFGVENYELVAEEEGGGTASQAGEHPFQLTSVVNLNTSVVAPNVTRQEPAGLVKDLSFRLPPGLIGNPTPFDQCTDVQFHKQECPPQSAVGVATPTFDAPNGTSFDTARAALYNMVPLPGEPARFAFEVAAVPVFLNTAVRTGGDYGVTVNVSNISEASGVLASKVTFWGVPGEAVHNTQRGFACLKLEECSSVTEKSSPPPLLSLPTVCDGPLATSVRADSWAEPHPAQPSVGPLFFESEMEGLFGCNHLQFNPEISVAPDVPDASTPTGLGVTVHVSQKSALFPEGLAESTLRNTTVALPAGVTVNPGGADGLLACSESQVGYVGHASGEPDENLFTPVLGSPFCPDASKIGTVEIETPLLAHVLKGAAYLAAQNENPFGSLIALYLIAEDPVSGTLVKLTGEVALNQDDGQLVTTFKDTPELPFENLRLHFFGESRAPLGTPSSCGAYTTQAVFTPWSGNASSHVSSRFDITSGPNGGPCPGSPLPFAPSLTAGTTSIQAGGFSPFTMTMSREDGQQDLKAVSLHMPPGLSGTLTGIPLCAEAQADTGTCGLESLIGETTVSVGLGNNPYTVTGGKVYLTGPYKGAPFGLSIVNPADAGPFHLGNVIVRARIEVDPHTAQLTITSDGSGPFAIPPRIKGIPLEIKHINVTVARPSFTFNPTSCNPQAIGGAISSIQGASANVVVPFQAANCATLAFAPKFAVTTSGKTSKADGASLAVRLTYPNAPQGSQANISQVKVELPKQLPSRLTTLQKACTAAQFDANPAGCPAASVIGHARATTPILPVALEGPAYFVSNGGEAFPNLIIVLQGYGVAVDLVGDTFINKAGVTSSTFKTVPDVPVGMFELVLPEEPNSALAANGNLCTSKLAMPTEFVGQNGVKINRSTPVSVTGCPKAKSLTRAQKLALALKACKKKDKSKKKRQACETKARKKYAPVKAKKSKKGATPKKK
jgi:hypothetical protein